eukprot:1404616-Amphidinium_carterae.1
MEQVWMFLQQFIQVGRRRALKRRSAPETVCSLGAICVPATALFDMSLSRSHSLVFCDWQL